MNQFTIALVVLFAVFMTSQCEQIDQDSDDFKELQKLMRDEGLPMPNPEMLAPEMEDEAVEKRGHKWIMDKLSNKSCYYVLHYRYCKYSVLRNYLCAATCRCKNVLSSYSCQKLKYKCGHALVKKYCRKTCHTCIKKYKG